MVLIVAPHKTVACCRRRRAVGMVFAKRARRAKIEPLESADNVCTAGPLPAMNQSIVRREIDKGIAKARVIRVGPALGR